MSNLTIEQVEKDFAHWRSHKNGHEKIPERLWAKVAILLSFHHHTQVLRRLGITNGQARNKKLLPRVAVSHEPLVNSLIKIPTEQPLSHDSTSNLASIMIERGETHLTLKSPSNEQFQFIINQLFK